MMVQDVAEYMERLGLGRLGEDVFLGGLPAQPDEAVALHEYGGKTGHAQANVGTPGLQVVVRAKEYGRAYHRLRQIRLALLRIGNEYGDLPEGAVLGGRRYFRVETALSGAADIGANENGRTRLAHSYYLYREEGTI